MSSGSTRQQSPTSRPPPAGQCATKATEDCVVGNRNTSMDGKLNESKKVVTSTAEKSQEAHTHTMASKHSKHAAKLPSQVTVNKKGSPIYMKQQETKEKNSKPPSQVSFGAEQRAAPLPSPTNSAPRRARGASSEEDSVAEMDYMSENSNISVTAKDLPPVDEQTASNDDEFIRPNNVMGTKLSIPWRSSSFSASPEATVASASGTTTPKSKPQFQESAASPSAATVKQRNVLPLSSSFPASTARKIMRDSDCKPPPLDDGEHRPLLPKFRDVQSCMWTASHAANCPSEDRSASLVNLLLQPLPPNFDSETQLPVLEPDYKTLIRLNLWAVIDGHGGGCVATYGSEVLLPHIAASVSRALGCAIVDRGVCKVNGQLRDANALDLDGLIQTSSDRSHGNPNSIHYRSPFERSDSEDEGNDGNRGANLSELDGDAVPETAGERKQIASLVAGGASIAGSLLQQQHRHQPGESGNEADASVSSVKTSVKTAASPANREELLGTHSPREVAAITRAITESFLAVDEGWINSIDPVATHQTSCQSNGRWNSGACALVVFTIQRLDWTSVSEPDREKELRGPEKSRRNTSENRDAARRRMLDYASRSKSASSFSTVSSTSSLTTEEAVNASGIESEITETEGEDDRSFDADIRKRDPARSFVQAANGEKESMISPPGGCLCHCYRPHGAMVYTAHVGDCRAVMLGSAPPRTIKVGDCSSHNDTTDDESSHHSSDETECLSSSDHDADSSEEEETEITNGADSMAVNTTTSANSSYMNFPRRVVRQRNAQRLAIEDTSGPYIALPPLENEEGKTTVEFDFETDIERRDSRRSVGKETSDSSTASQDSSIDLLPLVQLPPVTRPIDLTTDHSAYNPAEVTAVLRRCNNAPRAISAGVGGGIKRVAGSLAVTRALGDAYLKTPLLSFLPYKSHAPYITARPEVNCRPIVQEGDKVLVLATDGVWERASGEDVLRWVRNFYEERIAEARRRNRSRMNQIEKSQSSNDDSNNSGEAVASNKNFQQEGSERDLFEKNDTEGSNARKRGASSPVGPMAKRRKRSRQNRISYNVADVIVRRVLNKVRRARNISSLQALMSLPPGRARRSKHDDITASVVDLSAFVS